MKKRTNSRGTVLVLGVFTIASILAIINSKPKIETKELEINKTNIKDNKNTIAINVKESDNEEYQEKDTIPTGNYEIDTERSYCTKGNSTEHITPTPTMEYKDGKVFIKTDTSNSKCYVYLKKAKDPTADDTLAKLPGLEPKEKLEENFTGPSCDDTKEYCDDSGISQLKNMKQNGLFTGEDDYGTTYYFRGTVNNNWVKFAEHYWRIIRINGNGTIRLIYSGDTSAVETGNGTAINNGKVYRFNSSGKDNKYAGFMYGNASDNYENAHKNENKSIILKQIENWYEGKEDFLNKGIADQYRDKIDVSTGFCGDRGRYNGGGYEKQSTRYAAEGRLNNTRSQKPIFTCSNPTRDLYTMPNEEEKGNQALPVPVGLITADEEVYAGGFYASYNKEYWLYTGASYWTITPFYFSTYITIFYLTSDGYLHQDPTQNSHGIRPVINLKADTQFEVGGDGSSDKPFTVSLQ